MDKNTTIKIILSVFFVAMLLGGLAIGFYGGSQDISLARLIVAYFVFFIFSIVTTSLAIQKVCKCRKDINKEG